MSGCWLQSALQLFLRAHPGLASFLVLHSLIPNGGPPVDDLVTPLWAFAALLLPPVSAFVAAIVARRRSTYAGHPSVIVVNMLMPGAGLALAKRPLPEVMFGVMFAQASMMLIGGLADIRYWLPIALVGGVWASWHTPLNPINKLASVLASAGGSAHPEAADVELVRLAPKGRHPATSPGTRTPPVPEVEPEAGYSVAVSCSECGAHVTVPVLSHMAHCTYCGSDHLVVGQDDVLQVSLHEKIGDEKSLREAVLDHYRYQHYLKLFKRHVAPLMARADEAAGNARGLIDQRQADLASEAAEKMVSRRADSYRTELAGKLKVDHAVHFLAPYRHGMGTLYQAAFGRDPTAGDKRLRFALETLEASTPATTLVDLPAMGKLSYLKALIPASRYAGTIKVLPLDRDEHSLAKAFGNLDRKQLVRDLDIIRLGSAFVREVSAVVWRPWWITEVHAPGIKDTLLVDSASGSVAGHAPFLNPEVLEELPAAAAEPGHALRFLPMQCPVCGHEFAFDPDAVLQFCANCHRVCEVRGTGKTQVEYDHVPLPPEGDHDLVPFWRFPLELRTGDGQVLTDLFHLKDGIDGTLDQIGDDAAARRHAVYVPAIRCLNSKLMARAFNHLLFYTLKTPPRPVKGQLPLDVTLLPWSIDLAEQDARQMLPLFLANAFGPRDLARVNVHQVTSWLFQATQQRPGRLTYVPVPKQIGNPYRDYLGRLGARALHEVRSGA